VRLSRRVIGGLRVAGGGGGGDTVMQEGIDGNGVARGRRFDRGGGCGDGEGRARATFRHRRSADSLERETVGEWRGRGGQLSHLEGEGLGGALAAADGARRGV
jgi:hypothetical protein